MRLFRVPSMSLKQSSETTADVTRFSGFMINHLNSDLSNLNLKSSNSIRRCWSDVTSCTSDYLEDFKYEPPSVQDPPRLSFRYRIPSTIILAGSLLMSTIYGLIRNKPNS